MNRRCTSLARIATLLAVVLLPGAVRSQTTTSSPTTQSPPAESVPPQDTIFLKTFGAIGELGAMAVEFDRRGASVGRIHLLDHFATPKAARLADPTFADCYTLVNQVQVPGWPLLILYDTSKPRLFTQVEIENEVWSKEETGDAVTFRLDCKDGLVLEKTFRKQPGRRDLELSIVLKANGPTKVATGQSLQVLLEGLSLVNPKDDQPLGNPAIGIAATTRNNGLVNHVQAPSGKRDPPDLPDLANASHDELIDFAGTTNRFFGGFLFSDDQASRKALYRVEIESWPVLNPIAKHNPFSVPVAKYRLNLEVPAQGQATALHYRLYLGPKTPVEFNRQPEYARFHSVMDVDLSPACFCDIPGARQMARFLLWLLRVLESVVGSWGFAIVLLTLIVRTALVPLNFKMQKSMRAFGQKMSRLKPELDAIQKKFANDSKGKQLAMLEFNKKHRLTPPLGGCLPMFVTIPIFIGLFTALRVAYELRHQAFFFIHDLSQPDRLLMLNFWPHELNILPFIMVGLWFWLQAGTPLPTDPQQRQMMVMMRFMPLLFGFMLYSYASGLMVYMITSSLFGIVEQKITKRILGPLQPDAAGMTVAPAF